MMEMFIGIGVIYSLLYYEFTEISPGGLITPVYLALFVDQSDRIIGTLFIAVVIYFVVRVLGRYLPIYGKRWFAVAIVMGIIFKSVVSGWFMVSYTAIGTIIPGLIAYECNKQGLLKTIASLGIVTILLKAVLILMQGSFV